MERITDVHEGEEKQTYTCHTPTLQPVLITGITFSTFFSATVMKNRWKAISDISSFHLTAEWCYVIHDLLENSLSKSIGYNLGFGSCSAGGNFGFFKLVLWDAVDEVGEGIYAKAVTVWIILMDNCNDRKLEEPWLAQLPRSVPCYQHVLP